MSQIQITYILLVFQRITDFIKKQPLLQTIKDQNITNKILRTYCHTTWIKATNCQPQHTFNSERMTA